MKQNIITLNSNRYVIESNKSLCHVKDKQQVNHVSNSSSITPILHGLVSSTFTRSEKNAKETSGFLLS